MKKLIILCSLFFFGNNVFAQDLAAAQKRADHKINHMIVNLALDNEQIEKVTSLVSGVEQKNEVITADSMLTPEEKSDRKKMNKDGEKLILKEILTDAQFVQYEKTYFELTPAKLNSGVKPNIGAKRSAEQEK